MLYHHMCVVIIGPGAWLHRIDAGKEHLLGDHHYICNPHHPRKRNAQNGFLTPSRLVRRRPRASTTENNTWQSSHVSHFYFSYSVLRPTGLEQQAPLMYQKRIIIRKSIDCFHCCCGYVCKCIYEWNGEIVKYLVAVEKKQKLFQTFHTTMIWLQKCLVLAGSNFCTHTLTRRLMDWRLKSFSMQHTEPVPLGLNWKIAAEK